MSKFKKKKGNDTPGINTSSLPDIVFMLLFFFMVATKMRDKEMKVRTQLPQASQVEKLAKKSRLHYVFVGPPMDKNLGTTPRIQLDDAFADVSQVKDYIIMENSKKPAYLVPLMTTSLKADKSVKMGLIQDIKWELRQANALKLSYTAAREIEE